MKKQRVIAADSISQTYIMLNTVMENTKFLVHLVLKNNTRKITARKKSAILKAI